VTASSGGTGAVVAFLASPLATVATAGPAADTAVATAGYVNGVGLRVDGGITPYPP